MCKEQPSADEQLVELRWLIENADAELTADLPQDPVRLITRLRKRHPPQRSRSLVDLRELRSRGMAKFSRSERMFFTRRGLEQATDECLANYKANRFPPETEVVDICCGVGGDLLALAARGPTTGVDKDARILAFTAANLRVHGLKAKLCCAEADQVDVSSFSSWHLDPDRRQAGSRRSSPDYCDPSPEVIKRLLAANPSGAVKLSPAAERSSLDFPEVEFEWLGHRRGCQQLVLWSGVMARHPGKRVATWLWDDADGNPCVARLVQEQGPPAPLVLNMPRYVFEPRPSVLAAGLDDLLAARYGLSRLASGIAYLCSDHLVSNEPLLTAFEVVDVVPLRRKKLQQRLAALDGYVIEVKKRGVDVDPNQLQQTLPQRGGTPFSVILVPVNGTPRALLARRL